MRLNKKIEKELINEAIEYLYNIDVDKSIKENNIKIKSYDGQLYSDNNDYPLEKETLKEIVFEYKNFFLIRRNDFWSYKQIKFKK